MRAAPANPTPFPEVSAAQLGMDRNHAGTTGSRTTEGLWQQRHDLPARERRLDNGRHGLPHQRIGTDGEDGSSGTYFLLVYTDDILLYDEALNELGLSAGTKGERTLDAQALGLTVRRPGPTSERAPSSRSIPSSRLVATRLLCDDIEGIDRIVLEEVCRDFGGAFRLQGCPPRSTPVWTARQVLAHETSSGRTHVGSFRISSMAEARLGAASRSCHPTRRAMNVTRTAFA